MNMSPLVQANDNSWRGDWLLRRVNIHWPRQPDIRCISTARAAIALDAPRLRVRNVRFRLILQMATSSRLLRRGMSTSTWPACSTRFIVVTPDWVGRASMPLTNHLQIGFTLLVSMGCTAVRLRHRPEGSWTCRHRNARRSALQLPDGEWRRPQPQLTGGDMNVQQVSTEIGALRELPESPLVEALFGRRSRRFALNGMTGRASGSAVMLDLEGHDTWCVNVPRVAACHRGGRHRPGPDRPRLSGLRSRVPGAAVEVGR